MSLPKTLLIIFLLIVLIYFVSFFTSSETAFLSLRKLNVRKMLQEKKSRAKIVAALKDDMDSLLTTVLIGTNFINSLTSALATLFAIEIVGSGGVGIATVTISFFITVFGQIIPKTIAAHKPEETALKSSLVLYSLEKIFFPIIWLFTKLSHLIVCVLEKFIKPAPFAVTEEEIQTLIALGENEGTLEKSESQMLNKIFSFSDLTVSKIMQHRSLISMVSDKSTREEVINEFLNSGYSTIAIYHESKDDVVGIINYKSVLFETASENFSQDEKNYAAKIMSPVFYVPGTLSIFELLKNFHSQKLHFAVVLDEQGTTMGLVTMSDIMKVVFGRMIDENSLNEVPAENRVKIISANEFMLPGDLKIDDVNNLLGINLESEFYTTLGGWLLEKFGRLPNAGEIFINGKDIFIVEEQLSRRILSVRVRQGNAT